jgi:glycosyltransferase involved in cell wall biosynthesis
VLHVGPIDVVVLTKNSAKTIAQCLHAIKQNIDVSKLILVDDSDDRGKTTVIASKYTDQIHLCKGNIGEKRDYSLDLVTTPIFAFVDSDIIVNRQAFMRSVDILESRESISAVHNAVRAFDSRDFTSKETKQNLTFGFAILKTAALRRSRISHQSRGEDAATGTRLRRLGYEVAWQGEFPCIHLRTLTDTWAHYLEYGKRGHFEGHPSYVVRKVIEHRSMKMLILQLYFLAGYAEYRLRRFAA